MKRMASLIVMAMVIGLCLSIGVAFAGDTVIKAKITQTVVKFDKNGSEYVRLIINQDRNLGGVSYTVGVPVMAFKTEVAKAKMLKAGDILKAVCAERQYNGRKSYTIRAFLK